MIGAAYEAPLQASTYYTTINGGPSVSSAYSSSTTLVAQTMPQYPSLQTAKEYGLKSPDSKSSLDGVEDSSSPTHVRHLPLNRRIKRTPESSRANKTHLVSLDASSIEAFGGYGMPADAEYWRLAGRDRRYGAIGRFLQTLGLGRDKPAPTRSRSQPEGGARAAEVYEDSEGTITPGLSLVSPPRTAAV